MLVNGLSPVEKILEVCRNIEFDRNPQSVFNHMLTEIDELKQEIILKLNGQNPGPDGVLGEGVDVMLCLVDLIYQLLPDVTKEDFMERVNLKLDKWQRVYGRNEIVDAEFTEVKSV